ncbi:hypothetical protein ACQKNO_01295 [Bacillus paramycoides]|uniref:hypothetical protein n=1 Tax=Bacillus paramycoides TaxID=2026194 RepID=UPI003D0196C8
MKYTDETGSTLEVKYIIGLMYFIITLSDGRFLVCTFSESKAKNFTGIIDNHEVATELDLGCDSLNFIHLRGGGLGLSIHSKGMTMGIALNKEQAQELNRWLYQVQAL